MKIWRDCKEIGQEYVLSTQTVSINNGGASPQKIPLADFKGKGQDDNRVYIN